MDYAPADLFAASAFHSFFLQSVRQFGDSIIAGTVKLKGAFNERREIFVRNMDLVSFFADRFVAEF
jgi:hypothetical protein